MTLCRCGVRGHGRQCSYCAAVYRDRRTRLLPLGSAVTRVGWLLASLQRIAQHGGTADYGQLDSELREMEAVVSGLAERWQEDLCERAPRRPIEMAR